MMADATGSSTQDIFSTALFGTPSEAHWRALVDKVLKGKPFSTLVGKTSDDIEIQPLYPRFKTSREGLGDSRGWHVMARIDHRYPGAANAAAKTALGGGASGLTLVFDRGIGAYGFGLGLGLDGTGHANVTALLEPLLDGIHLDAGVPVTIDAGADALAVARGITALVGRSGVALSSVDVRFGIDPLGVTAVSGFAAQPWEAAAKTLGAGVVELVAQGCKGPLCLADGRVVHNAGGSEAQELAYVLGCGVAYLRALEDAGMPLATAREMIGLRLCADADQFVTMAKFRAMRLLWAQVEESCGLAARRIVIEAETAWRMMTRRDPSSNVLRTTLALVGAGLAGADFITVLPHTQVVGLPDDFARRLARNAQLVILGESHLDEVADPAAGSGGIEALTDALAAKAWALFQAMEARGGLAAELAAGGLQREVLRVRAERREATAFLRDPIVGTSVFPMLDEKPAEVLELAPVPGPAEPVPPEATPVVPLPPTRQAEPFERLRYYADLYSTRTGRRPGVMLIHLGEARDYLVRSRYALMLFEAGGFGAASIGVTSADGGDPELPPGEFEHSQARIACLCGSDAAYAEQALALVKLLRDRGATGIFIAGRPGADETLLRQAGVARYVYDGCDAVDALDAAHQAI